MGGACGTCGARRGECRVLVWIPHGKRPLGTFTRRWADNIKMEWIDLALLGTVGGPLSIR